jgi:ethanolamine utilization protein EutN
MLKAKVIGSTTSTIKHPSLGGKRMIVVQPYAPDGTTPDGDPLLAIDPSMGAGQSDFVIITSDGRIARELLAADNTPVRWTVIGISDQ